MAHSVNSSANLYRICSSRMKLVTGALRCTVEDITLFCACFGSGAFREALSEKQSHLRGHVSDGTVWPSFLTERNAGKKEPFIAHLSILAVLLLRMTLGAST